jgi:hypothetical protein
MHERFALAILPDLGNAPCHLHLATRNPKGFQRELRTPHIDSDVGLFRTLEICLIEGLDGAVRVLDNVLFVDIGGREEIFEVVARSLVDVDCPSLDTYDRHE